MNNKQILSGFLMIFVVSINARGQSIPLTESPSFLLRGTTCGATYSFPTMAASVSSLNAPSARLVVPELFLSGYLGDITVMQASSATIPSDPVTNEIFKVGATLQQDIDANASNLEFAIHVPGSGEQVFVDTNTTVIDYLKEQWFVEQQVWNITDPDEQTQRVKDAINYIRGKHNLEEQFGGPFRNRNYRKTDLSTPSWALGEVYGKVVVVPPPKMPYTELGYGQFKVDNANRTTVMFFGAGDGMIHAIYYDGTDAAMEGRQVYALLPSAIVPQLGGYTRPDYTRRGFVDGAMEAFDVYDGSQWKTILIATLNHGGKTITALDITDPANPVFKFEFSHANLGYTYSPVVAGGFLLSSTPGKKFYFLTAGGFENTDHRAYLIAFDASGNVVTTVQLPNDTDQPAADNGSMSITAFDSNTDGMTDAIYVGTYQGQIFRISTPGSDPASWSAPVLIADFSPLNITASPRITRTAGKTRIYAGTGRLLSTQDIDDTTQQYFAAFEENASVVTLSTLDQFESSWIDGPAQNPRRFVQLSLLLDVTADKGYAVKLPDQHKFVTPALLLSDGTLFATMDPKIEEGTPCTAPSGKTVLWHVAQTGNPGFSGNPNTDVDGDNRIEADDLLNQKAVAGVESSGAALVPFPQIEFNKLGLKVLLIQSYSGQINNGFEFAGLEKLTIRNRIKLRLDSWQESTSAK